jgi:hypothetical protein
MGNVAAPAGAVSVEEWADALTPDAFRLFRGATRTVALARGDDVEVITRGSQSADGTVEKRGILVYGLRRGHHVLGGPQRRGRAHRGGRRDRQFGRAMITRQRVTQS